MRSPQQASVLSVLAVTETHTAAVFGTASNSKQTLVSVTGQQALGCVRPRGRRNRPDCADP